MRKIEFVEYTGKYPNLCSGILTIKVDDIQYSLDGCLMVNGPFIIHNKYPWILFFACDDPFVHEIKFIKEELAYLEKLCNDHIPNGHCGGCS